MEMRAPSEGELRLLGVVFAGGGSSRMGADKALFPSLDAALPQAGETKELLWFERAARVLEARCTHVEIAVGAGGPRPRIEDSSWATFRDADLGAGPLAGLLASLRRARTLKLDGVLALACDMPFVVAGDLDPLLDGLRRGADVVRWSVPEPGAPPTPQPLVAAYRSSVEAAAEQALTRGARRLVAIDEESAAGGRRLRIEGIVAQENSVFRLVNVNTPTDYDAARTAAGAPSSTARRSSPRT